jgi:beta-N-acetylhexosaminidase
MRTTTREQVKDEGSAAPTQAPRSPLARQRERRGRRRGRYTRGQKLIIWSALIIALVASLPLGAYLTLKITGQQQVRGSSASPAATATPAGTPIARTVEPRLARYIQQMVAHMSLDEELGQMLVGAFLGTTLTPDLQQMIVDDHIGTIILYGGNMRSASQLQALDTAMQAKASTPLFISTDQEGGTVNRLLYISGPRPSAEEIGATNDPGKAKQQGVSDGQILSKLGINLNLAPVVDVQTVSDAVSVLPTRMFGTMPAKVAAFAGAYLDGLQSQGVIGCLKHWPGLGAATVDPHAGLPVLRHSQADLNKIDFAPYRALIAQGNVGTILTTHEIVPAYDPNLPASLSPILINQVLRGDLGFQGVIVTDGLHMGALSNRWTAAQAAVLAVVAGDDMLLSFQAYEIPGVFNALLAAINSGQITKARIDLSVERILALKIKYGLIQVPPAPAQG